VPVPAFARSCLVLDPKHVLESLTHSFSHCTHLFPSFSFTPATTSHRTSAAPPGHRRPAPTPLPDPNPTQLELRRDPPVLLNPANFGFLHPNTVPRSSGELSTPPPLSLSPTHRCEASPLQPIASSALHHPPGATQPLLLCPPSPKPQNADRHYRW
jgi:hypothetical protein